jgi:hypothetical protein
MPSPPQMSARTSSMGRSIRASRLAVEPLGAFGLQALGRLAFAVLGQEHLLHDVEDVGLALGRIALRPLGLGGFLRPLDQSRLQ